MPPWTINFHVDLKTTDLLHSIVLLTERLRQSEFGCLGTADEVLADADDLLRNRLARAG